MYGELFLASATSSRDAGVAFVLTYCILGFSLLGFYVFIRVVFTFLGELLDLMLPPRKEVDSPRLRDYFNQTNKPKG